MTEMTKTWFDKLAEGAPFLIWHEMESGVSIQLNCLKLRENEDFGKPQVGGFIHCHAVNAVITDYRSPMRGDLLFIDGDTYVETFDPDKHLKGS
jgi:hypothetical protein